MPIYMQYDGITGEVTAKGHEQWVEITGVQWNVARGISTPVGSAQDRNSTAPSVSEVTVSKLFDGASVGFFQELLTPGDAKTAKLDFVRTDKDQLTTFLSVELDEVMVSGYSMSSGGDGQPHESLSLNFTKISVTDTGTESTGSSGNPQTAMYSAKEASAG